MTPCKQTQSKLLTIRDTAKISPDLAAHVQQCSTCAAWLQALSSMQQAIIVAPKPDSSERKNAFINQFLAAPVVQAATERPAPKKAVPAKKSATNVPIESPRESIQLTEPKPKPATEQPVFTPTVRQPFSERVARLWPAGIAAGLILTFTFVWYGFFHTNDTPVAETPRDPFLNDVVATTMEIDRSNTTGERVKLYHQLADRIHEQARSLARVAPDELESLARMYATVVSDGLVAQANSLAPQEKQQLTDYVRRLAESEQAAERLAAEAPPQSIPHLKAIAQTARQGRIHLAKMRGQI
ncbi:MAG: hypothetical protein R3B84_24630 [Zavarzinella sp.]